MRILFYNFSLPYLLSENSEFEGGIAVETLNWIKAFRELNHDVGLLTWKGAQKIIKKRIDFDIIESYDKNRGIPKLRILYIQIPSLVREIKKYNPDVVIQSGANRYTFIIGVACKIAKKKFLHRIASDDDVNNRTDIMKDKSSLYLYKISKKLVSIFCVQNDYQLNILKNKFPNKHIFKIYNTFNRLNNLNLITRNKRNYIAWVGHFRKVKNLKTLSKICLELHIINFKIAGIAYNNLDNETKLAIDELKQMNNVEFVGYLDYSNIQPFLSNAICLLNTSFFEGFSNTFLEAWSVGTPVITTKNANPDNLIDQHHTGMVAQNFTELSSKLRQIIALEENEYNIISERCCDYVVNNHDPAKLAKHFLSQVNY